MLVKPEKRRVRLADQQGRRGRHKKVVRDGKEMKGRTRERGRARRAREGAGIRERSRGKQPRRP